MSGYIIGFLVTFILGFNDLLRKKYGIFIARIIFCTLATGITANIIRGLV